jgi:hypothetical protein
VEMGLSALLERGLLLVVEMGLSALLERSLL